METAATGASREAVWSQQREKRWKRWNCRWNEFIRQIDGTELTVIPASISLLAFAVAGVYPTRLTNVSVLLVISPESRNLRYTWLWIWNACIYIGGCAANPPPGKISCYRSREKFRLIDETDWTFPTDDGIGRTLVDHRAIFFVSLVNGGHILHFSSSCFREIERRYF